MKIISTLMKFIKKKEIFFLLFTLVALGIFYFISVIIDGDVVNQMIVENKEKISEDYSVDFLTALCWILILLPLILPFWIIARMVDRPGITN